MLAAMGCWETAILVALVVGLFGGFVLAVVLRITHRRTPKDKNRAS